MLRLNVQGNYLGVYINTESIDKQFLQKQFNEKDGVLVKCDPIQVFCGENTANGNPDLKWLGADSANYYNSYDVKSDHGWGELMELIEKINFDFDNLGDVLNIDRVLWAFAVNSAILNLDTYNGYYVHNYYLYRTEDGLFQMIPWDFDNSFAGAILGWDFFDPMVVYNYDTYGNQYAPNERPSLEKLLDDPYYKKLYNAHLRTVYTESLMDADAIRSSIDQLQATAYQRSYKTQTNFFRWGNSALMLKKIYGQAGVWRHHVHGHWTKCISIRPTNNVHTHTRNFKYEPQWRSTYCRCRLGC